jgi:hypothetical protein
MRSPYLPKAHKDVHHVAAAAASAAAAAAAAAAQIAGAVFAAADGSESF